MPKALHDALAKTARKKGLTGDAFDRYVYEGITNWEKRHRGTSKKKKSLAKPGN